MYLLLKLGLFSSSYEMLHLKYVNVFTCSNVILSVAILLLIYLSPSFKFHYFIV